MSKTAEAIRLLNEKIAAAGGPRPDWVRERESEAERWADDPDREPARVLLAEEP